MAREDLCKSCGQWHDPMLVRCPPKLAAVTSSTEKPIETMTGAAMPARTGIGGRGGSPGGNYALEKAEIATHFSGTRLTEPTRCYLPSSAVPKQGGGWKDSRSIQSCAVECEAGGSGFQGTIHHGRPA